MTANMGQTAEQAETILEEKIEEPPRYKVLMHNDDYTAMDFVVDVLCRIFHKSVENATAIMYAIHNTGIGECGIYTREVAETKVGKVRAEAKHAGYPLKCTMERI